MTSDIYSMIQRNTGENFYYGYGFKWRGLLSPSLVNVTLRNNDGSIIDEHYNQVEVAFLIDLLNNTRSLTEADFLEYTEKGLIDYVPVREAIIQPFNTLVLRFNLKEENYQNAVEAMVFEYRILGIPKRQIIDFDGFIRIDDK